MPISHDPSNIGFVEASSGSLLQYYKLNNEGSIRLLILDDYYIGAFTDPRLGSTSDGHSMSLPEIRGALAENPLVGCIAFSDLPNLESLVEDLTRLKCEFEEKCGFATHVLCDVRNELTKQDVFDEGVKPWFSANWPEPRLASFSSAWHADFRKSEIAEQICSAKESEKLWVWLGLKDESVELRLWPPTLHGYSPPSEWFSKENADVPHIQSDGGLRHAAALRTYWETITGMSYWNTTWLEIGEGCESSVLHEVVKRLVGSSALCGEVGRTGWSALKGPTFKVIPVLLASAAKGCGSAERWLSKLQLGKGAGFPILPDGQSPKQARLSLLSLVELFRALQVKRGGDYAVELCAVTEKSCSIVFGYDITRQHGVMTGDWQSLIEKLQWGDRAPIGGDTFDAFQRTLFRFGARNNGWSPVTRFSISVADGKTVLKMEAFE